VSFEHGVQLGRGSPLGLRKVKVRNSNTPGHPTSEHEVGLWAKVASASILISTRKKKRKPLQR
jgi:hypothetical protein